MPTCNRETTMFPVHAEIPKHAEILETLFPLKKVSEFVGKHFSFLGSKFCFRENVSRSWQTFMENLCKAYFAHHRLIASNQGAYIDSDSSI